MHLTHSLHSLEEPPRSASAAGSHQGQDGEVKATDETQEVSMETKPSIPLAPISSVGKPWAEEIELEWKADITRFDLTALRDFFKQGMDFSVVEEMVSRRHLFSYTCTQMHTYI